MGADGMWPFVTGLVFPVFIHAVACVSDSFLLGM